MPGHSPYVNPGANNNHHPLPCHTNVSLFLLQMHRMPTSRRLLSLVRAVALAMAMSQRQCHAFCPHSLQLRTALPADLRTNALQHFSPRRNVSRSRAESLFGKVADNEDEDRSRPKIVVIKNHEDYVNFLEEDDRLCIIKFYAHWCKSCQKFGMKYRHLAFEEGDHIDVEGDLVASGKVRFAEAEYSEAVKLCKTLKVRKLPTVHMYRKGEGKISDITCKPSLFHQVVDEVHRLMDAEATSAPGIQLENAAETNINNVTGTSFDDLAKDIMVSLKGKEKKSVTRKEKSSWFPFTS